MSAISNEIVEQAARALWADDYGTGWEEADLETLLGYRQRARSALEAAYDDIRRHLAEEIKSQRNAYLQSPQLNPAWTAGWHAATDHHVWFITREGGE